MRRRVRWLLPACALVAACVAVLMVPGVLVSERDTKPAVTPPQVAAADDKASLLLAVYQNDRGSLSCVNWSAEALEGRNVSKLTADELTRLGLTLSCDPAAARVLVVGIEGPLAALPTSDDRARAVAQCLSTTTPCSPGSFNPQTCASAGCLSQDVTVRIETLALK
ncbi:MAG: hypothetical protein QM783_08490 [Phycisphaerales bacterium]